MAQPAYGWHPLAIRPALQQEDVDLLAAGGVDHTECHEGEAWCPLCRLYPGPSSGQRDDREGGHSGPGSHRRCVLPWHRPVPHGIQSVGHQISRPWISYGYCLAHFGRCVAPVAIECARELMELPPHIPLMRRGMSRTRSVEDAQCASLCVFRVRASLLQPGANTMPAQRP
jgi:hypothetical protein